MMGFFVSARRQASGLFRYDPTLELTLQPELTVHSDKRDIMRSAGMACELSDNRLPCLFVTKPQLCEVCNDVWFLF
jgi:hypothetical protein